ncbi:glycine oxidase ThiO [Larsenimonas suaedae]|uniref:Glycine oxidase ThiO n=1 Tax=Larsenimonas suaedae TaxID=1851019 RepID=A0ABU1H027_9GAMM|nr:glycine oxidase ThiO [Larsenimonas suaedae]MCM2973710.1 glycine oxidase ThiO [Larsenimonas suaedae]MDR5897156.1 glycine oxidase ThiO [Larsenimonas suaedae]
MNDVVVIGGGVSGLMTAKYLVEAGASVTVIDRQDCAREASWAGGGIVSPLYPWRYRRCVNELARHSIAEYPQVVTALTEATGIDPEFSRPGIYYIDVDDTDDILEWARALSATVLPQEGPSIGASLPTLSHRYDSGVFMPGLGSLRTPRLGQALRRWAQESPHVRLLEGVEVKRVRIDQSRAIGVETSHSLLSAGDVVVCSGAWSGELLAANRITLPVYPVKGQMLLFKASPEFLSHVVLSHGFYAIPRRDGHVLVGSTFEEVGFDKTPSEQARALLFDQALDLFPALIDCPVVHHWAGLRPGAPDSIPHIGPVADIKGLWVNAGHFGNGVVLAPGASRLLVEQMTGDPCCVDPASYHTALKNCAMG